MRGSSLHAIPPLRLFHGPECLSQLGRELERLGSRRAVIFCGATLGRDERLLGLVKSAADGRCAGVFTGVQAHSPLPSVKAGAEALRQHQADAVIAFGGGSATVTARGASILFAEQRDIRELCTTRDQAGRLVSPKLLAPKLPQIIVPTTPSTAMSKAGTAVLDPDTKSRLALFDPKTRASALFFHPDLIASAPRMLLIDAGLNTLISACDGLMSRAGDPISDALLMHAVRLLVHRLAAQTELDDAASQSDLMFAAFMCGQGTDHTAGGLTTALGHAVAARCGIEAGRVKAILLPHAIRYNASAAEAGLAKLAAAMSLPDTPGQRTEAVITAIERLVRGLGLPQRLRDADVPRDALPDIAEAAMADWFLQGAPRRITEPGELQRILEAAW